MPRRWYRRQAQIGLPILILALPIILLLRLRFVRIAIVFVIVAVVLGLLSALLTVAVIGPDNEDLSALVFLLVYGASAVLSLCFWLRCQRRRRFRVQTFGELLALTPSQFEAAVGDLLHDLGYRDVRRVGGSGDLAADIWCRDRHRKSVVVQCKRYAPGARVGSPVIQTFVGMVAVHHQADRGIFVTTSAFTQPAIELARQHSITLIDGHELVRLVERAHSGNVHAR